MSDCEHEFTYGGVKYEIQEWKLPGSGAQPVYYYDHYFCRKCLEHRYERLNVTTSTYDKINFGATPKGKGI